MIKLVEKYTDLNGNEREDVLFFHLNKPELIELNYTDKGTLEDLVKSIIDTDNKAAMISLFKKILLLSYGKKSEDGLRFIKSKELTEEFAQSEAFSNLFMELLNDEKKAIAFCNGVIPEDMKDGGHEIKNA